MPIKIAASYVEFICVLLALFIYTFAMFFAYQVGWLYILALRMYQYFEFKRHKLRIIFTCCIIQLALANVIYFLYGFTSIVLCIAS